MPDVTDTFAETDQAAPGTWNITFDLVDALLPIPAIKEYQKESDSTRSDSSTSSFTDTPQDYATLLYSKECQ